MVEKSPPGRHRLCDHPRSSRRMRIMRYVYETNDLDWELLLLWAIFFLENMNMFQKMESIAKEVRHDLTEPPSAISSHAVSDRKDEKREDTTKVYSRTNTIE